MFANWEKFQTPPRHPKWKEINLAATVPGWTRWAPAEELLQVDAAAAAGAGLQCRIGARPPAASISTSCREAERERLYQEFQQWQQNPKR